MRDPRHRKQRDLSVEKAKARKTNLGGGPICWIWGRP